MQAADRPIGGEMPLSATSRGYAYLTDSGRSSLRLLLRSGFSDKRFLLPDFLCQIVANVFDDENVDYEFYRVKDDLTIDAADVRKRRFDVLYVIDYFGQRAEYAGIAPTQAWIVQDRVFSPDVRVPATDERWVGFNSLRKVSPLPDGSILHSGVELRSDLIQLPPAPFVECKTAAKRKKWAFIHDGAGVEAEYLSDFEHGEALIDSQRDVYAISEPSLHGLLTYYFELASERIARQRNYAVLDSRLSAYNIKLSSDFPSLYVLSVPNRDELRDYLRRKAIYLPVHWPNPRGLDNPLYRSVISVPVDSRYGEADMIRVADAIGSFFAGR